MKQKYFRPHSVFSLLILFHFVSLSGNTRAEEVGAVRFDWKIQDSGSRASLRGVSAVNGNIVWASGSSGTVLHTINGGNHWQLCRIPEAESLDFRDIQAFSENHAVVISAGRPAKIFRTGDGGKNWTQVYSNNQEGIFFDAFAFWDDKNGIAVGDPIQDRFMLITTEDGGRSWKEIPLEQRPQAGAGEGAFAASGTCLTVLGKEKAWFCTGGKVSRVFFSPDRGRSWKALDSTLAGESPSTGAFSITFADGLHGIVAGGDYKNETSMEGNAAVTSDGGLTWVKIAKNQPSGFRECAAFVPGARGEILVAVGPSGADFSRDQGKSWSPIPETPAGMHSIDFVKIKQIAWAVGKNGLIARLTVR